jgi:glycosyltransferase involved in cell wall biosynthesis
METSIIIPVYNEEENIKYLLDNLKKELKGNYEVIVIDDFSVDNTCAVVKEMLNVFPNLRFVRNQYEKGFANALRTGFVMARNEIVIPVMADLCDEIKIIPQMHNKILEGFDIVCGSRYIKGGERKKGPFLKSITSRYFNKIVHLITKIPNTDVTNPFKAYRKVILDKIKTKSKGFEISLELVLRAYFAGYKITELPTIWQERILGESKFYFIKNSIGYLKGFLHAAFKT